MGEGDEVLPLALAHSPSPLSQISLASGRPPHLSPYPARHSAEASSGAPQSAPSPGQMCGGQGTHPSDSLSHSLRKPAWLERGGTGCPLAPRSACIIAVPVGNR